MHPLGSRETADKFSTIVETIVEIGYFNSLIISGSPMRDICFTNR